MFKNPFKPGRVYAAPEPVNNKREEAVMGDVYGGPEQMPMSVPAKDNKPNDADFRAVYAGPDMMERMRVPDPDSVTPFDQQPYPFNNAVNGIDSPAMPGTDGEMETCTCPSCGQKSRCLKFCEYCGVNLK